ncbi:Ig-like domain-containing protein [Streptomyces sp. NPDC000963]|uniref:L,D-transpeptidase n=1 Tax=unclassified Streptomyces TaxID=2593676 RepID=UPI0013930148|nr:L,D-transpeptidase family protein [Streptomyces sp. SID2131]
MNDTPRIRTVLSCTLLAVTVTAGATACSGSDDRPLTVKAYDAADQLAVGLPADGAKADPEKPLEINAKGDEGRITDVTAVDAAGRHLAGELTADGRRWRSTATLAAGARYTVRVATEDGDGAPGARTFTFETAPAKRALTATFGPEAGTYGVGQPITADLSLPVKDRASRAVVERALKVRSTPAVEGAWYWVDDKKLHFRPKEYWPAGARVTVSGNLDGLKVGDKLYGGESKPLELTIGDRIEAVADAGTHQMTVKRNGEVINTIPVTTGKPGFDTRNGVKVVLGKEYYVRMRGTTVGIAEGSSESYDLPVYYATRVTWSGEYVHAAPWSVGSQGVANVSHGCVGMSMDNAAWFFKTVRAGDIVQTVNSDGDTMERFGNGFGDWNLTWDKWREGSALAEAAGEPVVSTEQARLRPSL